MSLGILLIQKVPPKILFFNDYFRQISRGKADTIANVVFKDLAHMSEKLAFRCDMQLEKGFVVGYSVYKITDLDFLIFLNDISHKKIHFENSGENRFYDRLSGLLAEVVHEVGNPLTALNTTLQVLYENMPLWNRKRKEEYLMRAIDEIDRLSNYLDRMRTFSRIDVCYQQTVKLEPIVQRVIEQNSVMIAKKGLQLSCRIDPGLEVFIDDDQFYQVMLNLFLNSVDILPPQGKISITDEGVNEFFVKLVYRNNGPPIPEQVIEKIFIPFFSTKKNGSGIGLAVSLKLMTRMGGTLKVDQPEPGWGAKFVLFIPVSSDKMCEKKLDEK